MLTQNPKFQKETSSKTTAEQTITKTRPLWRAAMSKPEKGSYTRPRFQEVGEEVIERIKNAPETDQDL